MKDGKTEIVRTKSVDLAALVNKHAINDYVVLKMDVEGSEYTLLPDMLKKGALNKIDAIGVEYHTSLSPDNQPYDISVFNQIFTVFGIQIFAWG